MSHAANVLQIVVNQQEGADVSAHVPLAASCPRCAPVVPKLHTQELAREILLEERMCRLLQRKLT